MPVISATRGERVTPDRLQSLRTLVRSGAPSTSVYLRAAGPGARPHDLAHRWRAMRPALEEQGATAADIAAVAVATRHVPPKAGGLAAIAANGRLVVDAHLDDYQGPDIATYGRWPRLMPLLAPGRPEEWQEATRRRRVVSGAHDVRRALDAASVQRLLVVPGVIPDRLADELVAATLATGADVTVGEAGSAVVTDGVAALLRP